MRDDNDNEKIIRTINKHDNDCDDNDNNDNDDDNNEYKGLLLSSL